MKVDNLPTIKFALWYDGIRVRQGEKGFPCGCRLKYVLSESEQNKFC